MKNRVALGHTVTMAQTGKDGLRTARLKRFDLLIVDIGLPDLSGLEVVASLRRSGDLTPVIFLTARSSEEDVVRGLNQGADLYVSKPFSIPELKARIRALMRFVAQSKENEITFGDLTINQVSKQVTRNGRPIHLTDLEFRILVVLMKGAETGVSRDGILNQVWGIDFDPGTVTLDVHLSRIRKKLQEHGPPIIQSIRGYGWKLQERA